MIHKDTGLAALAEDQTEGKKLRQEIRYIQFEPDRGSPQKMCSV